jgi:chemotaxis protein MotB
MVRATFTSIISVAILAGGGAAYAASPDSKAAKEFATQKDGVCCFVGMKNLPDEAAAKSAQYPDLSGQLADANRNLAKKESENADLARQLAASKAGQNPDRAGEVAALTAAMAAKESDNADLNRQLAASKTKPAPFAVLLEREYFNTGSAELKPEGIKKLKQLSDDLKAKAGPDTEIRIEGHTDNRPIHNAAFSSNWDLSSARANAVGNNLHANGIDGERLLEIGYGPARPAEPNTSDESMAMNRRVEIILTPALSAKPH